jgi:class 3 adenylate cyclase/CHASE2 domain-containing sensor protein
LAGIARGALVFGVSVAFALALTTPPSPLAAADRWLEGVFYRFFSPAQAPSERIVIVGITEETIDQFPYRSPIDRAFLADLVRRLDAAAPAAIGLDLLIERPTEPEKDAALRYAVDHATAPIVFAASGPPMASPPPEGFRGEFLAGRRLGDAALAPDRTFDGTIHTYLARGPKGEPSFAAALAQACGAASPAASFHIRWRRGGEAGPAFPVYPAHLVAALPATWLRGKIVLVGSLVPGQDEHRTPVSLFSRPSYGVEIHAQALAQILDGAASDTGPWPARAAVALTAAAGLALAAAANGPVLALGLAVLLVFVCVGSAALFSGGGPLILPTTPTLGACFAAGGVRALRGWRLRKDQRLLSQMFARFVSAPVARELWRDRATFLSSGRPRPQELVATVLFSDVAGFTALSEPLPPEPLIDWLDRYIDVMVQTIAAHDGVVLRFVGDGILAAFGVPVPRRSEAEIDKDAQNAVRCALAMAAAMRKLNEGWRATGLPTAGMRIGVHTGPLVAGSLGHGEKIEYCLLGDTANTGARIEALGKEHALGPEDCVILAGEPTYQRLRGGVAAHAVGRVLLRGKERPVGVYRILCPAPAAKPFPQA